MNKNIFNSFFSVMILCLFIAPAFATEGAPEIPTGIGPLVVSGIVMSIAAIKSYINKK